MRLKSAKIDPNAIRVVIVEDDPGIRESLGELLQRSPSFSLAGRYGDGESALVDVPKIKPDVVLMDINLPQIDGVECVRQLKPLVPATQFVMLTVYEDNERLFKSLMAGASGYLLKRTSHANVLAAIQEVCAGGAPMSPQIARRVVQHFRPTPGQEPEVELLAPREKVFLDHLARGYRYKEIADMMGISMDTVRSYVRTIYDKLHVHSRTEAVVKYLKQ
ncbi:MAG TPA: response regulator transcription factor [Candidatus Limnocylindria bacterium]|jgi:DNA-binding NarL/FixJ family response regulator|nr:response regulator transcription factor [Candidatus Limnocylindria bacterium]